MEQRSGTEMKEEVDRHLLACGPSDRRRQGCRRSRVLGFKKVKGFHGYSIK